MYRQKEVFRMSEVESDAVSQSTILGEPPPRLIHAAVVHAGRPASQMGHACCSTSSVISVVPAYGRGAACFFAVAGDRDDNAWTGRSRSVLPPAGLALTFLDADGRYRSDLAPPTAQPRSGVVASTRSTPTASYLVVSGCRGGPTNNTIYQAGGEAALTGHGFTAF